MGESSFTSWDQIMEEFGMTDEEAEAMMNVVRRCHYCFEIIPYESIVECDDQARMMCWTCYESWADAEGAQP